METDAASSSLPKAIVSASHSWGSPRYILIGQTLAQLNGQRATSNVSTVAAYPSCGAHKRLSTGLEG